MKKLFSLFALLTVFIGANADTKEIFKWHNAENSADYVAEVGSAECLGGDANNRINYKQLGYFTISLNGKKADIGDGTANGTYIKVTPTQALKEGDVISMTAFRNKGDESKKSTAWLVFSDKVTGEIGKSPEFPDINGGGDPETITLTVTKEMAGFTSFSITRGSTGTNLFITSLVVTTTEEAPAPQGYDAVLYNGDSTPIELKNFDPTVKPAEATAANAIIVVDANLSDVEGVIPNVVYTVGEIEAEPGTLILDGFKKIRVANELNIIDAQPFYQAVDFTAKKLTYTRTFTNTEWQSIALPIPFIGADFEGKAEIATFTGATMYDEDNDGIYDMAYLLYESEMNKENNPLPFDPVLIKAKEVGEMTITWEDMSVFFTNQKGGEIYFDQSGTKYFLRTTYQPKAMYQTGYYGLSNGEFKYALSENAVLPPFRVYLEITPGDGPQVPVCGLLVDDDANAIKQLNANKADNNYYDLSGRKVLNPTSGIYVKNGKKVLVK